MTSAEFVRVLEEFMGAQRSLLRAKGNDYQTNDDRLSNFKTVAELTGLTPTQVWSVFFMKHVTAIMKFVRSGELRDESIQSRLHDAANYAVLLDAIVREQAAALDVDYRDVAPLIDHGVSPLGGFGGAALNGID